MSIVKINAITVPADSGDELARRFADRAGAVDNQPGFEGFELLKPIDDRMAGRQHTVDALLAVVALAQRRPAVLLTSEPGDMTRLTEEPDRKRSERVAVVSV
ncbi:MAG: antibiotic biosynthesis monooxygenase [Nocardiopsaceae bacterium]|nr:antibiotic biosynthesis monooxygenase [Nocardiopsaceae bacterium]